MIIKYPSDFLESARERIKNLFGFNSLNALVTVLTDEEVIRCRDCAHMFEMMDGFECERMSGQYHTCEPNGFCSWAERRKND